MSNDGSENELEQDNKSDEKRSKRRLIIEFLVYIVMIYIIVFFIPHYVIERAIVDGTSMMTTLEDKDQLIMEKLSVRFDKLDRFDVVIFFPKGDTTGDYYIKRIIGLPGETIQIINENIYINGDVINEEYGSTEMFYSGLASEKIQLGEDEYFVLGDNRANSTDSRDESVGIVKRSYIEGKVMIRLWPLNSFGAFD